MLNPTPSRTEIEFEQVAVREESPSKLSLLALFEAEESVLLRYAYAMTGRRAVAEEIVQEVFLQLHARWEQVESPRAWLYRCVHNRALNHLRRCKREKLSCDDSLSTLAVDEFGDAPDVVLSQLEDIVQLRALLLGLSESDQRLLRLKFFEGYKYREISEHTGLSIGNVGYRLHMIMQKLASQLRQSRNEE